MNFHYRAGVGGSGWAGLKKLEKGGGTMVQGQVFLKGGRNFSYLISICSRFIIFTFRKITFEKLFYASEEKLFFSAILIL